MRHNGIRIALCLGIAGHSHFAKASHVEVIPLDYELINHPAPELTVVNPFFMINGKAIKGAKYSLDGEWGENQCSRDDRNGDGKTCGKPLIIQPGPHIINVLLCTDADCTRFGDAWSQSLRFSVAPREKLTFDLKKFGDAKLRDRAISRQMQHADMSPCARAVESAFFVNTCHAAGVKTFGEKMDAMETVCRATWSKDTDLLLSLAIWVTSYLPPERCYTPEELKKLPPFISDYTDAGFWPKGTVEEGLSSWAWARSTDEGILFSKYKGQEFRKQARKAVGDWYERQIVVDQLIAALLDPQKNLAQLINASKASPWDVNPSRPIGHRDFAITVLTNSIKEFSNNRDVAALVARGSAGDKKIHCDYKPEVTQTIQSILADGELSNAEWQAVIGFINRTPPDASLFECMDVFRDSVKSPIPQLDRLRLLAKADCAKNRSKDVRGKTIQYLTAPNFLVVPENLKATLAKDFPDCVAYQPKITPTIGAEKEARNAAKAAEWQATDEKITASIKDMTNACKANIRTEIVKKSFENRLESWAPASYCADGIHQVELLCGEKKGPELVSKWIKKITCRGASVKASGFTDLVAGNLIIEVGQSYGFDENMAWQYLKNHLK